MKWRHLVLLLVGLGWSGWGFLYRPFPLLGEHGWLNPPGPAKRCRQTNQYCNTISQPLTS